MRKWIQKSLFVLALVVLGLAVSEQKADAAKKKTYTISTSKKPIVSKYQKSSTYNSNTKHYYLIRSYLEKIEKNGGGTLVLKKGTYKVCTTLYVPSNVTIKLKSGATIKKTSKTGTKKLKSEKELFAFIKQSKSTGKKIKALKASRNVTIQGSGTAIINMGKESGAIAFAMAHNYNITVKGIQFKYRNGGSYIALSGCRKINIEKCKFYEGTKKNGSDHVYAIRLETATKATDSLGFSWSNLDNTVNKSITIDNCYFSGLRGAIGSVKYAVPNIKGTKTILYQESITITNNRFKDIELQVIKPMVWKASKITNNQFYRGDKTVKTLNGVLACGISNLTIKDNSFNYISVPIEFQVASNNGKGKGYEQVKNSVSAVNTENMAINTVYNADHYYIPYNNGSPTRLIYFNDMTDNNLTILPNAIPYREHYTSSAYYCENTQDYFQFRAAMEQLELVGGGTLTIKAGQYNVSNAIYVPSNVSVIFEEDVKINKVAAKYTTSLTEPKAMFVFCPPSKAGTNGTIGGYDGSHDISFKGTGTTDIDCNYKDNAIAIIMGHCANISFSGIRFSRYYGYHLMELNSSTNVLIEGCTFSDFNPSKTDLDSNGEQKTYKEAINIDGSDGAVGGINYSWNNGDKTICSNITIRNNSFLNIGAAIGSHNYSADGENQLYHTGVKILNNSISSSLNSGIRGVNWKDTEIIGNSFKNIGKDDNGEYGTSNYGVYMRGAVNVTIKSNIFDTCYYPICIYKTAQFGSAGYPETVSQLTEQNWLDMKDNTLIDCKYERIRLTADYEETELPTDYGLKMGTTFKYVKFDKKNCTTTSK